MAYRQRLGSSLRTGSCAAFYLGLAALCASPGESLAAAVAQPASVLGYQLNIPAQGLGQALQELALASKLKLFYKSELVQGKTSPELRGYYTAQQAFETLLRDTGLEFDISSESVVIIRLQSTERSARETVTLAVAQVEAVVASEPAGEQSNMMVMDATPVAAGSTLITGRVVQSGTGAGLAGALVRIIETRQEITTNALGQFRFPPSAAGDFTLYVSYLGYAAQRREIHGLGGDKLIFNVTLQVADEDHPETVMVFGNRSARAQALNQQRTAENSAAVISADTLGNFTGTTLSDALRRVPGVAFQRDPKTGEGTNIIIRGLEPDMNAIKLNGLNLPVGNGLSRSADLSNFLADSISKITVHKTLLPSHDSAGTGGLVEIETRSPLERERRYANFSLESGRRGQDFADETIGSGTISGIFGEQQRFGLSASTQFREREGKTITYGSGLNFGHYLPAGASSVYSLDPRLNFPYETGASPTDVFANNIAIGAEETSTRTMATTLAAEWQPYDHTSLKLDIQRSESRSDQYSASSLIGMDSAIIERPVAALDGEVRPALTYEYLAYVSQDYQLADNGRNTTDTYSLRGNTAVAKWTIDYTLGFASGRLKGPSAKAFGLGFQRSPADSGALDSSYFLPGAVDAVEGLIISPFGRRNPRSGFQLPLGSDALWNLFNSPEYYDYRQGAILPRQDGRNDRRTAQFDVKYDADWGPLSYLQVGANYEESKAFTRLSGGTSYDPVLQWVEDPDVPYPLAVYPSVAPLGLVFEPTALSRAGVNGRSLNYLSEASVRNFLGQIADYSQGDEPILTARSLLFADPLLNRSYIEEESLATYLQARVNIGKLEIIGGARMNRVNVLNVAPTAPSLRDELGFDVILPPEFTHIVKQRATETDVLPRVGLNYRQTDNLVFRGGYFLTTARPSLEQLSDDEQVSLDLQPGYGPNQNQPLLGIFRGNPRLQPAVTHNFDLSVEYYDNAIGLVSLAGFYKRIEHQLALNKVQNVQDISDVTLPDHPAFNNLPDDLYVETYQPVNSPDKAHIWGAEASIERQFTFLPGAWGGLGIYANMTYADSSGPREYSYFGPDPDDPSRFKEQTLRFPHENFDTSPRTSGTVALTYNRSGVDGALTYGFQERYLSQWTPNNLDIYTESVGTLDLRTSYFFTWKEVQMRVWLEGRDLLKGTGDPDLEQSVGSGGMPKYIYSGTFLGGREFRLGVSATF
jgi:TonB-dependent receptor